MDKNILAALVVPYVQKNKDVRFLLLKHERGIWTFPGGVIEDTDENIKQGLVREVAEEIGLEVKEAELRGTGIKNEFTYGPEKEDREGKKGMTHFFLLELNGTEKFSSFDKITEFGWFKRDEVVDLLPFEGEREVFNQIWDKYFSLDKSSS